MSAGCMRWMLSHTARAVCGGGLGCGTPVPSRFLMCTGRFTIAAAAAWRESPFCTTADNPKQTQPPSKEKKQFPLKNAMNSGVGHNIPYPQIQVISETGENMGIMICAHALKIMEEKDLKLVLLNARKDPPVYRLMSGKQIHEEQMRQREKRKGKAAPVQVKELTLSTVIGAHDITSKLKQVKSWLEKKHHVRIILQSKSKGPTSNLETNLEQMVYQMEVKVGFVSKPQVIRNGKAAVCIIRPPSAKELAQKKKEEASPPSSANSSSPPAPPVSNTDTAEGPPQH